MIDILYSDEHIAVCVKPRGVSSQEDGTDRSMPALLRNQLEKEYVAVIHRLDKDVSGVMVYALSNTAAAKLSQMTAENKLTKQYLAVVSGTPAEKEATLTDLLYHDKRKNKSYTVKKERRGVKKASLSYEVTDTCLTNDIIFTLVKVQLHTGRTHQIRVQFASRRHPLLGDRKYGGIGSCPIALFSQKLSFDHPITGKKLTFSAEPPSEYPWDCFNSKVSG